MLINKLSKFVLSILLPIPGMIVVVPRLGLSTLETVCLSFSVFCGFYLLMADCLGCISYIKQQDRRRYK